MVTCPNGYYSTLVFNINKCYTCDTNCLTCITKSTFCLSCGPGLYLQVIYVYFKNNVCVAVCSDGFYANVVAGANVCSACDSNCATCLTTAINCLTCTNSYLYIPESKCY